MLNFNERRSSEKLTERQLERKIYNEGLNSNAEDNPYSYALDIRSFCLFAAGVNDK